MADSHNNLWMAEFTEGHLGKIDAKTGAVTWYATPTAHARARRMEIDDQDRIMVTEYRANKVALFDTKTEQFTEVVAAAVHVPLSRQLRQERRDLGFDHVAPTASSALDPKTAETVQYLMPSDTNMRTVFVDNSTSPVTFWVGSNHDHRLVKVEPLD